MLTRAEARDYCQTLLAHFKARLNAWEDTFVRDIQIKLERGDVLSVKQDEALDRIMDRCARSYDGSTNEGDGN